MILVAAPYVGPGLLAVRSDLDLDVQDSSHLSSLERQLMSCCIMLGLWHYFRTLLPIHSSLGCHNLSREVELIVIYFNDARDLWPSWQSNSFRLG